MKNLTLKYTMQNTFSFDRLRMLIYKHAVENWKLYIISFIVMSIPIYITNITIERTKHLPLFDNYIFLMILSCGVYTGMFFTKWTDKSKGSSYIMLPATVFEKITLVMFYTILIFIPLYTGVFYGESFLLTKIYHPGEDILFMGQSGEHSIFYTFVCEVIVPYLFFQSLFLFSNIWLKKSQVIRLLIFLGSSWVAIFVFNFKYLTWLSGNSNVFVSEKMILFPVTLNYSGSSDYTIFTSPLIANVSVLVLFLITILVYMASYFKLKEKEI